MTESIGDDHERYADWDGAYVVGALSHVDRLEYERHLGGCRACRASIAALAPMPGLLARLAPAEAAALLEEEPADAGPGLPPDLEQRLLAAAGVPRISVWRRTSTRVGLGLAAAAAVAAAVVVPIELSSDHGGAGPVPGTVAVALQPKVETPLSAEVAFIPKPWGTQVHMTCRYAHEPWEAQHSYALYVVDAGGRATLVSRWHAGPGQTSRTSGSTDLAVADISHVELRDGVTGRLLLAGTPT